MRDSGARREGMLVVLGQFRILLRSIREHYRSSEEEAGLGGAQLWALAEIAGNADMNVSDLARQLAIHLSTASNLVSRLEEMGLVVRKRVAHDQRIVRLAATPEGRKTLRGAPRPLVGALQQALLLLPPARIDALQRELAAVLRHMKLRGARAARGLPLAELLDPASTSSRDRKRPAASHSRRRAGSPRKTTGRI